MRFTSPALLILLLALPLLAVIGWPSRSLERRREIVSLALRLLIALCLVLSLAGFEIARASGALAVVFLIDASDSMPDTAKAVAVDYTRRAIAGMGPDDQAAVVVFGGDALVERGMSSSPELGSIRSIPNTGQTDLAEAIRLALALYPPGAARRMVILSDGAETTGDALEAARLAAAIPGGDVEIVALPFVVQPGAEALITGVELPARLRQGDRFDLRVSLHATEPMRAGVRVLAGEQVVYESTVDLNRGNQSISIPLTSGEPGFASFVVQIDPERDTHYQNNELAAFSQVEGPPRVLVVAPPEGSTFTPGGESRPDEYSHLVRVLEATGFVVDIALPSELPSELALLAEYVSVVLVDVPARELSQRQMQTVQSYVRDLGGGLVAVGGPTSYGVGGYFRTPLEETLPVEMQIKDEQRRPALAIVFVIDHSGSMSDLSGGASKLDLAKEAAARSVEMMFPTDRVGVIAFDDAAQWVVPMTGLSDPDSVISAIGSIRSGGGTDIYAGLLAMSGVLPDDPASVKHVILLTDGGADPTGIPELVRRLYEDNGITLTTVGVGRDAAPFLPQLAQIGGGRYHFAADPGSIPSIFTEETTLATRAYLVEESFFPKQVGPSPILAGITEAPALLGYVATTAKQAAQMILVSHEDDPILAAWQYGLGRAVAFTSDATGRWAQNWIGWDGFPVFWSQAVRFTLGDPSQSALDVRVEQETEDARLVVDARNERGEYLNGYTLEANVVAPGGQVEPVTLRQVAPGRYEATFQPGAQGAYLIGVSGQAPDGGALSDTAGWVLSYSPEYRSLESDPDALYRLVVAADGRIATENPADAFAHTRPAPNATRPLWQWLLTLAALLLPLDIAVRRLVIGRADVQRGWSKVVSAIRSLGRARPQVAQRSSRMEALIRAKERTRETSDVPAPTHRPFRVPPLTRESRPPEAEAAPRAGQETADRQPAPKRAPDAAPASTTSALLGKKRARRERRE